MADVGRGADHQPGLVDRPPRYPEPPLLFHQGRNRDPEPPRVPWRLHSL